jgi:hypothetical protein
MNKITNITRRKVFDVLLNTYSQDYLLGIPQKRFNFWGTLMPSEFLERLYDLKQIPSNKKKYRNAKEELDSFKFGVPQDLPWDWIFNDERFPIKKGSDEDLLDFICTVLHPEVRDDNLLDFDSPLWSTVYQSINSLLACDGYFIIVDGYISNQFVYSWVDQEKHSLQTISGEISDFSNLFIRNGGILDFSQTDFHSFCMSVLGFGLCPIYHSTKEKSFSQFIYEGNDNEVKKMLVALLNYYEQSPKYRIERTKDNHYANMYNKCKKVVLNFDSYNALIDSYTMDVLEDFSSDYLRSQIELMFDSQSKNPTEAIGKAKELIESCCRTILRERDKHIDEDWTLSKLVRMTQESLHILPENVSDGTPGATALKVLLGKLSVIVQQLATIRNEFGTGHGKDSSYTGLEERHAKLAIGSSVTLVNFLWTSHIMMPKN